MDRAKEARGDDLVKMAELIEERKVSGILLIPLFSI